MVELVVLRCSLLTPLFCPPKQGNNSCSTIHWCRKAVQVGKWRRRKAEVQQGHLLEGGWVKPSSPGQSSTESWILMNWHLLQSQLTWGVRKRFNFSWNGKAKHRGHLKYPCCIPGFIPFPVFYNSLDSGSPPHQNARNAFYTQLPKCHLNFLKKYSILVQ